MKMVNRKTHGTEMKIKCVKSSKNKQSINLRTGLLSLIDRQEARIHQQLNQMTTMIAILTQQKKLITLMPMAGGQALSMLHKFSSIHNKLRRQSR
jgi:hypothetical protein